MELTDEHRDWMQSRPNFYSYQRYGWSSFGKVDCRRIWDAIHGSCDWDNKRVLDIGCERGYHSIQSALAGASYTLGTDVVRGSVEDAEYIAREIYHLDTGRVRFEVRDFQPWYEDIPGEFDIILYLSIHHHPDPYYFFLKQKVRELKSKAEHVFAEFLCPPVTGLSQIGHGMPEAEIFSFMEKIGAEHILTTDKVVRGPRHLFHIRG